MTQLLRAATCAALLLTPAIAHANSADSFAGLAPLSSTELKDLRGGMMIGGLPVDFAVVLRTTVEGVNQTVAGLQTTLTFNGTGGIASSTSIPIGTLPTVGTEIIQQISAGQIQTMIANATSGVSINHSTSIDATLPGFQQANQNFSNRFASARIGADAALAGLRR